MATLINHSADHGLTFPATSLALCLGPAHGEYSLIFSDNLGQLYELWRGPNAPTGPAGLRNLTEETGAPRVLGQPNAFVDTSRSMKLVVFRDSERIVHSIYWSPGAISSQKLSGTAQTAMAPEARSSPVGFSTYNNWRRVIYKSGPTGPSLQPRHLHSLWWPSPEEPPVYEADLTAVASPPAPLALSLTAYGGSEGLSEVIFTGVGGHIHRLAWKTGQPLHEDLSASAGTPRALNWFDSPTVSPSAYYTPHNDMNQIVYLAEDGHLWELYWHGHHATTGFDLMEHLEAPQPIAPLVTYYGPGTNTKHVIYLYGTELHELWWVPGGTDPAHNNLSWVFNAPEASAEIVGFEVEGSHSQHVGYIGADGHIYELIW